MPHDPMNLPTRYADATHENAQEVADAVLSGRNAYVYGPVGTGKTHLACAAARIVWDTPKDATYGLRRQVRFVSVVDLLAGFRSAISDHTSEAALVSELVRADVLVLDDLGKEQPTEWALSRLYQVINGRWDERVPCVVTSNLSPKELSGHLAARSPEMSGAIASRLLGDGCKVVRLSGQDLRFGRVTT